MEVFLHIKLNYLEWNAFDCETILLNWIVWNKIFLSFNCEKKKKYLYWTELFRVELFDKTE